MWSSTEIEEFLCGIKGKLWSSTQLDKAIILEISKIPILFMPNACHYFAECSQSFWLHCIHCTCRDDKFKISHKCFFFFRSDSSHSNTYKWICRQILISIFGQIFNLNMKKADDEREKIYWKDVHLWWHLCLLHVEIFTKFRFISFFPRLFNHSFSFYLSFCAVFVCFFIHSFGISLHFHRGYSFLQATIRKQNRVNIWL